LRSPRGVSPFAGAVVPVPALRITSGIHPGSVEAPPFFVVFVIPECYTPASAAPGEKAAVYTRH
jgi:hypothetical protein